MHNEKQFSATQTDYSVWVRASAGSGKTKCLTDRVIKFLLNKVSPSKILCLTYTKAAAAEMSMRIYLRLQSFASMEEAHLIEELKKLYGFNYSESHLKEAKTAFFNVIDSTRPLQIKTIHAFCQQTLNKFPFEAGLKAGFRIIDDSEVQTIFEHIWQQVLSEAQKDSNTELAKSIKMISAETSANYIEKLLIEKIIAGQGKFLKLLEEGLESQLARIEKIFDVDLANYCIKQQEMQLLSDIPDIGCDFETLKQSTKKSDQELYIKIKLYNSNPILENLLDIFLTKKFEPRKKIISKEYEYLFPDLEHQTNSCAEFVEKRKSIIAARLSSAMLHVATSLLAKYQVYKYKENLVDYSDLLILCQKLLANPEISDWILYKLDGGLEHVLLDEAQDTSDESWQILLKLCEEFFVGLSSQTMERTLFVVGDEKQSIYSFQGANVSLFYAANGHVANITKAANKNFANITLDRSFRSTKAVLDIVDQVFNSPVIREQYLLSNEQIQHLSHREQHLGQVQLWPLVTCENENDEEWGYYNSHQEHNSHQQILAKVIAQKIAQMLSENKYLPSQKRNIKAEDIMILVRRRTSLVDLIFKELSEKNIPVAGSDRLKLLENIAVLDLLTLAKFVLLPDDDLNLAALLKSPFCGISEEELFELCYNRSGSLWSRLVAKPNMFTKFLMNILKKSSYQNIYEFYQYILIELGGQNILQNALGSSINDVINEFLYIVYDYNQNKDQSLSNFINYIEQSQLILKRDMDKVQGAVRILTVHSSKGLEAPVVILADTTSMPLADRSGLIMKDFMFFWYHRSENAPAYIKALREENKQEEMAEYFRLLYVAMTRAKDDLIICGSASKCGDKVTIPEECWYNIVTSELEKIAIKEEFILDEGLVQYLASKEGLVYHTGSNENMAVQSQNKEAIIPERNYFELKFIPPERQEKLVKQTQYFETNNEAINRGLAIHKLLEFSNILQKDQLDKISSIIETKYNSEALGLGKIPNLDGQIFHEISFITKNEAGELTVGRIDKLVIYENSIHIIDYKTSINPSDEIARNYIEQLQFYATSLSKIYPHKEILGSIYWTQTGQLQEIYKNVSTRSIVESLPILS